MAGELFAYTNLIYIAMRSAGRQLFPRMNLLSEPHELLLHNVPCRLRIISDTMFHCYVTGEYFLYG